MEKRSLYEINREFESLVDIETDDINWELLADPETGEIDTEKLSELEIERQSKFEAVALYRQSLLNEAEAIRTYCKQYIERRNEVAEALERKAESLGNYILSNLGEKEKISTEKISIGSRYNPESVEYDPARKKALIEALKASEYADCVSVRTTEDISKSKIKALLQNGAQIDGFCLLKKRSLVVK